jgi:hypothetical protein
MRSIWIGRLRAEHCVSRHRPVSDAEATRLRGRREDLGIRLRDMAAGLGIGLGRLLSMEDGTASEEDKPSIGHGSAGSKVGRPARGVSRCNALLVAVGSDSARHLSRCARTAAAASLQSPSAALMTSASPPKMPGRLSRRNRSRAKRSISFRRRNSRSSSCISLAWVLSRTINSAKTMTKDAAYLWHTLARPLKDRAMEQGAKASVSLGMAS